MPNQSIMVSSQKGEKVGKVKKFNYLFQFNYWLPRKGEKVRGDSGVFALFQLNFFTLIIMVGPEKGEKEKVFCPGL